jgi:hypothetical protein
MAAELKTLNLKKTFSFLQNMDLYNDECGEQVPSNLIGPNRIDKNGCGGLTMIENDIFGARDDAPVEDDDEDKKDPAEMNLSISSLNNIQFIKEDMSLLKKAHGGGDNDFEKVPSELKPMSLATSSGKQGNRPQS